MHEYKAVVVKVFDADTITVDIDLGLGVWKKGEKIRLYGINAPEVRGKEKVEGKEARDWLRGYILGRTVRIKTIKDKKGKYGRYLGIVYLDQKGAEAISVNDALVANGYAVKKDY